ncbi:MAG: sulfite exporter TauE/SafE family protein, partial [Frankia sp.]|nr:sulfite exporter TauE/SafE family protein [Frankia sp.]
EEPVLVAAGATVSAAAVAAAAGTASVSASSSTTVSASVAAAPAVAGGGPADGAARGRMAGVARSAAARVRRAGRVTLGTVLFVLGFTAVFVSFGAAFGGLGQWLQVHQTDLAKVLGAITIVMGLLFAGAFARLPLANREIRFLHRLPARGGLLGAPLLGVLFGLGWTPCIGPTLSAVLGLAVQSATAGRGALLSAVYCLGLGIPFIAVGLAFRRLAGALRAVRAHARLLSIAGGVLLVAVGIAQVTGEWTELVDTLRRYTPGFAEAPL